MERLNPVFMTALTAGLALLPLALAGGEPGNEIQSPMAVVVLGGLLTSLALNMVVVPVLYMRYGTAGRDRMTDPKLLRAALVLLAAGLCLLLMPMEAFAHGVTAGDKGYIQEVSGVLLIPFAYLGAKHMVTGYDHLLFLLGIIFFLYRLKDIGLYVSPLPSVIRPR
jgi:hypothetical protein